MRGSDEQGGGDDEVAAHVAEPPGSPDGADLAGVDLVADEQAGDADRRAHHRAHPTGEDREADDVADPIERRPEVDEALQQVGADDRLERVAER